MPRFWCSLVAACLVASALAPSAAGYHKIIIVDRSGSMSDPAPGEQPATPKYRQVVQLVLEEIELDLAAKIDRITLVFFDSQVSGVVEVGSMAEARRAMDAFPPQGQTNIGDTLAYALELLTKNPGERYFVVSLYTDGQEALADRKAQKVTMEEARRRFVQHLGGIKQRTFVSFYNHQWNSPENQDFSRLLKSIQTETAGNANLDVIIEENPDPSRRSQYAGIVVRLDREKVYLERPREGDTAEIDLGLAFQAMPLAHQSKLVYSLKPVIVGADDLVLKLEPSRLVLDKPGGTVPLKLLVKGLAKIAENKAYELEIQPSLVEAEVDNLLLEKIKTRKVVLRMMPERLYAQFTMAPTPSFDVEQPRGLAVATELKVGHVRHHEVTLSWNQTAVGSRVQWTFSPSLQGAATLVDSAQRRLETHKLVLDSTLRRTFFLRLELKGGGGVKGTLDLAGDGKLVGRAMKVDVSIAEQRGTLQVQFPDTADRKIFAGAPVVSPLGLQLKPDRFAVGEAFVIRTEAPAGVKLEVRDEFDRPIGGKTLAIEGTQLAHYALRLELDPGVAVDQLDSSRIKLFVTPKDSNRLVVTGADGQPAGEFPLPFALVAPQRELVARFDGAASRQLRRGTAAVLVPVELAWSADANREAFDVELVPEVLGRDRGAPKDGLECAWDDGATGPRTVALGRTPATTHRLAFRLAAKGEGEWVLALEVRALGKTQRLELPVRAVVGEANVSFAPATEPAVAGVAAPIGVLRVGPRNPFAAGQAFTVLATSQPGVELGFVDRATGKRLDAGQPWTLPDGGELALEVLVSARAGYEVLGRGLDPANALVLKSAGASLELFQDGHQEAALAIPLSWTLTRPTLAHRAGDAVSGDLVLGSKAMSAAELVTAPALALKMGLEVGALPEDLAKRLRGESVTVGFREDARTAVIDSVVFTVSGRADATIEQLVRDAGFTVRFKPDAAHGLVATTFVYAELVLETTAPVDLATPMLRVKLELPPRLKLPALAGILVGLLILTVGVAKLFAGKGGASRALVGALETGAGQRVALDGFEVLWLSVEGGRLAASSVRGDRAIARVSGGARGVLVVRAGDQRVIVGGIDVAAQPVALADGATLTLGGLSAVYRQRSQEAAAAGAIDLSAPRPASEAPRAISLDALASTQKQAVEPVAPPPPSQDDEDGIVL